MKEYTFEITFTDKGKEFKATIVVECRLGNADITEMVIHAIKDVFSHHPTANNLNWKIL